MGDSSKFGTIFQYYIFNISFMIMIISEATIFIKTHQKSRNVKKRDRGTLWLLISCYTVCIYLSVWMVGIYAPSKVRMLVIPHWCSYIGIGMILAGVVIRLIAVSTLKKAFTVSVQTTDNQKLITTGIYRIVRNPAYTGSIISLIGVAVSYRSIVGMVVVSILSILCYDMRIRTEEKALQEEFGEEFAEYCKDSWRLIPYIW